MYNVTFKSDVLVHDISINRQINITLIIPRFSVANTLTKNQFHIPLFSIPRRAERTMCLYRERSKNEGGRRREAGGKEGEGRGRVGMKREGGREKGRRGAQHPPVLRPPHLSPFTPYSSRASSSPSSSPESVTLPLNVRNARNRGD